MLTHFIFDAHLPHCGKQTRVVWSILPSKGALVFVHGFNGSPIGSWADFPIRIRQNLDFAEWDAFFFGYDGLHTEMVSSSAELRALLDRMEDPAALYNSSDASPHTARRHPKTYERILLVGHSLGAIVSRRAILDGYNGRTPATWVNKTHLFNFAPAHCGAKIEALLMQAFASLRTLTTLAQLANRFTVLRDLKVGSSTLRQLEIETITGLKSGRKNLRAIDVVWAKNDNVVINSSFAEDPSPSPHHVVDNRSHITVCKPDDDYGLPIDALGSFAI